jgi:pyruvate kinase
MMRRNRRAKIVATLGPASSDATIIRRLFEAGVDVFRLNFSHGSKEDHASRYEIIRRIERELGRPIAILQDLQGPKIRIGTAAAEAVLQVGRWCRFRQAAGRQSAPAASPLLHPVYQAIAPGHQVLINDGRVRLEVIGCGSTHFDARVMVGGEINDRKGVNLPTPCCNSHRSRPRTVLIWNSACPSVSTA